MKIFLFSMLFTLSATAMEWWELESGEHYKLNQSFELAPNIALKTDDEVVFKYQLGIPGLKTHIFVFDYLNCPGSQEHTEMEYFPVNGKQPHRVGIQLDSGCEINVFVELKDFFNESWCR